ncbi:placenta-specific gene 8 protein-like [Ylistrum balloti]|uniref:placenta-specific gene 8 protein-like n=1 Tax=Ylistrum balloti TaxID=509963 RepID=UPI002905F5A0|nr:placenta-specific gene 8 protein-like [Ylistrum balloti]
MEIDEEEKVLMSGTYNFNNDNGVVESQPTSMAPLVVKDREQSPAASQTTRSEPGGKQVGPSPSSVPFDDAHCERNWTQTLFSCQSEDRNRCSLCCCWPYHKYMVATRLGETPFMALIPCAVFALRIKVRTLFGIKGSLLGDFWASMCCEPCAVCQMTSELDSLGL